jgi:hypothetical protein
VDSTLDELRKEIPALKDALGDTRVTRLNMKSLLDSKTDEVLVLAAKMQEVNVSSGRNTPFKEVLKRAALAITGVSPTTETHGTETTPGAKKVVAKPTSAARATGRTSADTVDLKQKAIEEGNAVLAKFGIDPKA